MFYLYIHMKGSYWGQASLWGRNISLYVLSRSKLLTSISCSGDHQAPLDQFCAGHLAPVVGNLSGQPIHHLPETLGKAHTWDISQHGLCSRDIGKAMADISHPVFVSNAWFQMCFAQDISHKSCHLVDRRGAAATDIQHLPRRLRHFKG